MPMAGKIANGFEDPGRQRVPAVPEEAVLVGCER